MTDTASSGEVKLACVAEQIDLIRLGKQKFLGCPYCGHKNKRGKMCCELLERAVAAITQAEIVAQQMEIRERIDAAN